MVRRALRTTARPLAHHPVAFVRVSSNVLVLSDATPIGGRSPPGRTSHESHTSVLGATKSLLDDPLGLFATVVGHRQVTDAHLVSLAIRRGGMLPTFDRGSCLATACPSAWVTMSG